MYNNCCSIVMLEIIKYWQQKKNDLNYRAFLNQKRYVNYKLKHARKEYYQCLFENHKGDYKTIYKLSNHLLFRKETLPLPTSSDNETLAELFNSFFVSKIAKIMKSLKPEKPEDINPNYIESTLEIESVFSDFTLLDDQAAMELLSKSANKSCELDLIPTYLLKEQSNISVSTLKNIVNASLEQGVFPQSLRSAIVRPMLKKAGLELIEKNYRPVSNLAFLGKLIERAACNQIVDYTSRSGKTEEYQAAYRAGNSTETALLKVQTDILEAIDKREVMCVILLDLSAAFDTVSHHLLLNRLKHRYGIEGKVLSWLQSYLSKRSQSVVVGNVVSKPVELNCGVPQGSILGPVLYTLYTAPLGDICRSHGIVFICYADDTQLYLSFRPSSDLSKTNAIKRLEDCIMDIRLWMRTNLLKLNDDKTECIIFGTQQQLNKIQEFTINIGDNSITSTPTVRNLGYFMDKQLKQKEQVKKICSSTYLTLKNINRVRSALSKETIKILVQGLVVSRMDYCNSLLLGAHECYISKLQLMQNMAARTICGLRKYDRISSSLQDLHWLKIRERINYKVLVFVYQCVNNLAPIYLQSLLKYNHGRMLRSHSDNKLPVLKANLEQVRRSSFRYAGPRPWNELPVYVINSDTISIFKSRLKTFLFCKCYNIEYRF